MSQITFKAREAKNNFGRLLDEARRAPVSIEKNGRKVAVLISQENYTKFQDFEDVIDAYWGKKTIDAIKTGKLGLVKSKKFLDQLLNA